MTTAGDLAELLRGRRAAYVQLRDAIRVLRAGNLFWTEAALLALVELIAERRLVQFGGLVDDDPADDAE